MIDFKENLHLNMGFEKPSYSYYDKPQRAYFSFAVYYKNEQNKIQIKFFDIISDNLSKNGFWVCYTLENIFKSIEWQQLNCKTLFLWMDNGPHFKTKELCSFLFDNNNNKFSFAISWNYFIEGHGKSICDTYFSKVSEALKIWSKENEKFITSTNSAIQAISKMFSFWKQQTIEKNLLKKATTLKSDDSFYDLIIKNLEIPVASFKTILDFQNIKLYYYFEKLNNLFYASILTNKP